jgi:hypothetical protein
VTLQLGDLLLLATDGVFDNLHLPELSSLVSENVQLTVLSRVVCGEPVKVGAVGRWTRARQAPLPPTPARTRAIPPPPPPHPPLPTYLLWCPCSSRPPSLVRSACCAGQCGTCPHPCWLPWCDSCRRCPLLPQEVVAAHEEGFVLDVSAPAPGAPSLALHQAALKVASAAFRASVDPDRRTPFEVHSKGAFKGGKQDDITVVVGMVVPAAKL